MPTVKELHVNGTKHAIDADADRSLLSVLRDDLGLSGCKYGCGEGRCGACTVILDGERIRSCNTRVGTVGAKKIRTVESLCTGDQLHPVQQAFLDCNAMQCGYCTSGMIMSAVSILEDDPAVKRDDIVRLMNVNICRCGTYQRIVSAIEQAAVTMKGGAK
jgi:aerobic-type carbon monoxide dehydrogenase small subunit (CoxS/CutS family)